MKAEFKRVVQAILSAEDEPLACEPHRPSIPAYVEAELDGQNVKSLYPQLAKHLETCPDCYEEYEDLRHILDLERQGRLEEPPRPGQFDFSFLRELPPEPRLWTVTEANVRRLVTDVTAQLGTALVALASLPEALIPYHRRLAPAFVFKARAVAEPELEDLVEVLDLPDREANVRIRLLMGPVQAGRGTVKVQVEELEPLRHVAHARVTLRDYEMHLLESIPTTSEGTVTFKDLKVGKYVIQVQRNASRWEFGLTIH